MKDKVDSSKRSMLKGTLVGAAGLVVGAAVWSKSGGLHHAQAQVLPSGVREGSVLAKVKKEGSLKIGWSPTPPLFFKDPKSGKIEGVFKDLCDLMCKELEVQPNYQEVSWGNSTVGLRAGDFDLFGSSLTFNAPRGLAVNYVGPLWSKGTLALVHKDNAHKFKTAADFNQEDVVFSLSSGSNEPQRIPVLFPKAKVITTGGQSQLAAEPVRAKKADLFALGDIDVILFQNKNKDWAVVVDAANPFDRRMTTWAIRHGDLEWKNFVDIWAQNAVLNGEVQRLYAGYVDRLMRG